MQQHLSTSPIIRNATRSDIPELVTLINVLNTHEGIAATMNAHHAEQMLFSNGVMRCVVAEHAHALCGFVLFYAGYDTASISFGFHIADIFVSPEHQRDGIGRALMRDVAALCLHENGQWCSLTAARSNLAANAFYDALGFATPDVTFRAIGATGLQRLVDAGK